MKTKALLSQVSLFSWFVLVLCACSAKAATCYSIAAYGNWDANTTWSLTSGGAPAGTFPQSSDAVVIERNCNVTVNVSSAACASIQLGSPAGTSSAGTPSLSSSVRVRVPSDCGRRRKSARSSGWSISIAIPG